MADRAVTVEVWEGKGFWRMAQITLQDGTLAQQADVLCITESLYDVNAVSQGSPIWTDDLAIADHIYDSPQTGTEWETDTLGYNFLRKFPGRLVGMEGGRDFELWHKIEFRGDDEDVERLVTRIKALSVPEGER